VNKGMLKRCCEKGSFEEVLQTRVSCRGVANKGKLKRCYERG